MASFTTEINGRSIAWQIRIDYAMAKKLKAAGFDILDASPKRYLGGVLDDSYAMIDVVVLLIEDQLRRENVTQDDFLRSVHGELLDAIPMMLHEAIADFFPPSRRKLLRLVTEKATMLQAAAMKVAEEKIATFGDPAMSLPER